MNIIAVSKDTEIISEVTTAVNNVHTDNTIRGFDDPMRAVQFGAENKVDVAVIGTKQRNMNCLAFAEMLLQRYPDIALVFHTKSNDEWNFIKDSIKCKQIRKPITWEEFESAGLVKRAV